MQDRPRVRSRSDEALTGGTLQVDRLLRVTYGQKVKALLTAHQAPTHQAAHRRTRRLPGTSNAMPSTVIATPLNTVITAMPSTSNTMPSTVITTMPSTVIVDRGRGPVSHIGSQPGAHAQHPPRVHLMGSPTKADGDLSPFEPCAVATACDWFGEHSDENRGRDLIDLVCASYLESTNDHPIVSNRRSVFRLLDALFGGGRR